MFVSGIPAVIINDPNPNFPVYLQSSKDFPFAPFSLEAFGACPNSIFLTLHEKIFAQLFWKAQAPRKSKARDSPCPGLLEIALLHGLCWKRGRSAGWERGKGRGGRGMTVEFGTWVVSPPRGLCTASFPVILCWGE